MIVRRAEVTGMCPGVRNAVQTAFAIPYPREVTILGELVHNEQVLGDLARRGFHMVSESDRDRLPPTPKVLAPAHGISQRQVSRLARAGKQVIDATCPFVREIRETAQALKREGRLVIVIGKRGHVEVEGIVGDLDRYEVVAETSEVASYPSARLGVVCQSTTASKNAERIVQAIRASNPGKDIRYVPTICPATCDRQAAVRSLLGHVDALVVVGGKNSNNTIELVKLARSREVPCFHVQTAADIRPDWFRSMDVVGLTAGASTPDAVIESVYETLFTLDVEAGTPALLRA